jgi:hypothetical protein
MRLRRTAPDRTAKPGKAGKAANSGRHRTPAGEQQGADLTTDHELESYLAAIAPVRDPEVTDPGRTFGSAKVYQLRLPPGAEEKIEWLAQRQGLSTLALLQDWVLQRLHQEFSPPDHR